ncbi:hypothetical protein MNB_SV-13-1113 [hydrothermal vent metagenome]|uniref:Addiction module protein n=1 Tax=hydrothermal vent metagenome TaxID=652676 RepID=A0A1W1CL43_9ZZZZ
MPILDKIYADIVTLKPREKLILVDKILSSIYPSNIGVERVWGNESEERLEAYQKDHISAIEADSILKKYDS